MPDSHVELCCASLSTCLTSALSVVGSVDVSGLDSSRVDSLLSDVRRLQRGLDGLVVRLGGRAAELAADGTSGSAEEVLRGSGAVGARQARREARRSEIASDLPELAAAVSDGRTTGEHVDAVARGLSKVAEDDRAKLPLAHIVAKAEELPVEAFDRFLKRQVERVTASKLRDTIAKREASEFRHWFDERTGMGRFAGALEPERYEVLVNAVEQRTVELARRDNRPLTVNLAAAALVELSQGSSGPGARPAITVVVDHQTIADERTNRSICQTENGHDLPLESVARLLCDATVRRVELDESCVPIRVGRKYRTATDAQWAALKAVHDSCAWDGCQAPISWCQAHHILEWEHGGRTDLENLVPLCAQHHHRVHEGQWHIKLLPDRSLVIHRPDGTHHKTVPTPMRC